MVQEFTYLGVNSIPPVGGGGGGLLMPAPSLNSSQFQEIYDNASIS